MDPVSAPEEIAACLGAEQSPSHLLESAPEFRALFAGPQRFGTYCTAHEARLLDASERVSLRIGSHPLHESETMVPSGIPRPRAYVNTAVSTKSMQIIIDEDRPYLCFATPDPLHKGPVEDAPEVSLIRNVAEPSAIFSIAACGDER